MADMLHYRIDGAEDAPWLLLGSSIGTDLRMWDDNVADLAQEHRVLRFDTRGHGGSPAPSGPYDLTGLAADVVALADRLGIAQFAYGGLSLGGAIGQQLALDVPGRLTALVLCCTAARFGEASSWRERAARVRAEGTAWLVEPSRLRWFADPGTPQADELLAGLAAMSPDGYAGCADALAGFDVRDRLPEITLPTLVIAGKEDPATPLTHAELLADGIPGADLVVLPDAAHLATVEQPDAANRAILDHLRKARP